MCACVHAMHLSTPSTTPISCDWRLLKFTRAVLYAAPHTCNEIYYLVLINKGDATVKLMTLTDKMGGYFNSFPDDKQMFHQLQLYVHTVLHKNLLKLIHVCGVKMSKKIIFIWL